MFRNVLAHILHAALFICAGAGSAAAQEASPAPVTGVVVDSSGGAIGGATVTLRAPKTAERVTTSDGAGRFVFTSVPAGPVVVVVTRDRFTSVRTDVDPARADLRVVLNPVPVVEEVTVRAPALTTSSITATRTETPLREVPQAISIISKDLIADQMMLSMGDVVRYVPGIGMAQGEGNRDTPVFRGNSSTSDFFVDGIRDDVQYFRDLYNVERIEAFKGPNAMIFGRGGVGGVINRVTRQADRRPTRELSLQTGSWSHRRVTGDVGQAVNDRVALRLTGVYENSDTYRQGVGIERYGVNPTIGVSLGPKTTLRAGYEFFHDDRNADRGIPSFNGRPVATDAETFFGRADVSVADVTVNVLSSLLEHRFSSRVTLRNRISYGDYDKFYQNVFPGAVNSAGTVVSISAYNNATDRRNLFNQTDLIFSQRTGSVDHTFLTGVEVGRQVTDNFRSTGYFTSLSPATTSTTVPLSNPTTSLPVTFQQSATDADNHGVATVAAIYAQDQIAFSDRVQAIVGVRYDSFKVDFLNNRTADTLASTDGLVSPRLGFVVKPALPLSIYTSYSLSYLPRAGEQLSSLRLTTQALDPEEFRNYEVGAKWDVRPALSLTATVYRLDRGNVVVTDPLDPTVSLLVDAQRTKGLELGLTGNVTSAWSVAGAYAYQDGEITRSLSATAQAGARLAQLPEHTFSLWNKYAPSTRWGLGLGIVHRGDIFASTDNTVTLPAFTRVDGAVYVTLTRQLRAQLNIENLFGEDYYASAHNNNITPGSPRAARVSLTTRF
ncbi:MAG: TonB-dependent siderophore receptor [Vicinamibacterales bacterium]